MKTDKASLLTSVVSGDYLQNVEGVRELIQATKALRNGVGGSDTLTQRGQQIMRCIANGLANKEIAEELGLSRSTVANHITTIFKALEVSDRTAAIMVCLKMGYLRLEELQDKSDHR